MPSIAADTVHAIQKRLEFVEPTFLEQPQLRSHFVSYCRQDTVLI